MASRWNENEIEIIKKHFTTMTNKEIKDKYLPHRSTASIAYMGSKYGLIKDIRTTRGWSKENVEIVKKYYPIMKTSDIRDLFLPNFTEKQIDEFSTKCLHLKKEKDYFVGWTKEEVSYLINNYEDSELSQSDFGKKINKSENQVCYVARALGLKKSENVRKIIALNAMKKSQILSKPQEIVNNILDELNITQEREKIFDYYAVDSFLCDYNLIIEVNGDYWHYSPLLSEGRKKSKFGTRDVGRDKAKHTYIKNKYNIEILYLWETDIIKNPNLCKKLILEYVNNNGLLNNYHSFNYFINENDELCEINDYIKMAY